MTYPLRLTIYIVSAVLTGSCLCLFLFYGPIKRLLYDRYTPQMYYRQIKKVTLDHDFFLINKFVNKIGGVSPFHIDHLMIGDKFIYVIRDRYYAGAIEGKKDDAKWLYHRGKKTMSIDNPLQLNKTRVDRLVLISGLDAKLFVSIVLVNSDCQINLGDMSGKDSFVVSLDKFPKLIELLESEEANPLDPSKTPLLARDFAEMNLNGKE